MQKRKETPLMRVKRYVDSTNQILVSNRLKVAGNYKTVDGVRCVEVILDGNFIYPHRIELLCNHTDTVLYAIRLFDRHICMLLEDK